MQRSFAWFAWYCSDCEHAHHADDAPRDVLGERGTVARIAYAWCERERAYHLLKLYADNPDKVTRYDVCARPNGVTRERHIARKRPVTSQRGADPTVTTSIVDWRAYRDAYDAQRSRIGPCMSGCNVA